MWKDNIIQFSECSHENFKWMIHNRSSSHSLSCQYKLMFDLVSHDHLIFARRDFQIVWNPLLCKDNTED